MLVKHQCFKRKHQETADNRFVFGLIIVLSWGIICVVCRSNIYDLFGVAIPVKYSDMPISFNGFWKLISYVFVYLLIASFMFLVPMRSIPIISHMGRNTLSVYIYHLAFRAWMYRYQIPEIICRTRIGILGYILLNIVLTLLLSLDIVSIPVNILKKLCFKEDSFNSVDA